MNDYRPTNRDFLVKGQQLSLREAAEFDRKMGAREKLTGWGKIARERAKGKRAA